MHLSSNNKEHHYPPHKKRKISCKKTKAIHYLSNNRTLKTSLSLRDNVEPWSIGQRIIIQIFDINQSQIGREATIRDYDPDTHLTHIWFETEENNFENIDLSSLEEWDVANNKPLYKQLEFVPDKHWTPYYWKLGQRVTVIFDGKFGKGSNFTAFIDAYDPISRRHHINYGDTKEWIWATKDRVKIYEQRCADYIEIKLKQFLNETYQVSVPPWNPTPYGLDETFAHKSIQIEHRRKRNLNIVSSRNKNMNIMQKNNEKRKKIFGNKTVPRIRRKMYEMERNDTQQNTNRLMKTAPCVNLDKMMSSRISSKNTKRHQMKEAQTNVMSIKSWSSSDSMFDSDTQSGNKNTNIERKCEDNSFEPIQVSVTTNIVVRPRSKSSKKKKISLRIPKKAISNRIRINTSSKESVSRSQKKVVVKHDRKHKKYPRKAIINGQHWIRHYSRNDRKYYWLMTNDNEQIVAKEWDPWRKYGKKAPWRNSLEKWGKFMDTKKREYYYNYDTKQSTFKRPKGFESDAEIEYDSAENVHERK